MSAARGPTWELLESIGAYAAGDLAGEEAREAERLISSDPDGQQLAARYATMLAFLGALSEEAPEPPEAIMTSAVRRAYLSAFFRQAEDFFGGLTRDYAEAFVYYLGLRRPETAG